MFAIVSMLFYSYMYQAYNVHVPSLHRKCIITESKPTINEKSSYFFFKLILFYIITSLLQIKICIMFIKILFNYRAFRGQWTHFQGKPTQSEQIQVEYVVRANGPDTVAIHP